jgi:endonuclease-3 related protein
MNFKQVFQHLFKEYGPQHWWPGDTPFEVMVGAILTQNTAWTNVERAIANLKANRALSPEGILAAPEKELAEWLRPSGYFNIKAKRLRNFCRWYMDVGQYKELATWDTHTLRRALLSVNGVGPETADDMMLYAFERPVFVIDAYTRRLFQRLGLIAGGETYEQLRTVFEENLPSDVPLFNEYHALIVQHAKDICKKRPQCDECLFGEKCRFEDME